MNLEKQLLLDELLTLGVDSLDLTEAQHKDAIAKYEAVGRWLDAPDSALRPYSPAIFPQGSMAIGTTNKSVGRDERDIDLVCEIALPTDFTQAQAKQLLGERLRENAIYADMLKEKNRCWRLIYAGLFHMDILPAKPDHQMPTATALVVPDKKLSRWKETDPKGYAAWFGTQAARSLIQKSSTFRAGIEPVPAYNSVWNKTPLQVAVQLLKRHRDVSLNGNDDAPISIIITTLAAHAYQGHDSVYATLLSLLERMPHYIEYDSNNLPYVRNPTNALENFADKWHLMPVKKLVFDQWILQARNDLRLLTSATLNKSADPLSRFLGEHHMNQVLRKYGKQMNTQRKSGLRVAPITGLLGASGSRSAEVRNNTFFGAPTRIKGLR